MKRVSIILCLVITSVITSSVLCFGQKSNNSNAKLNNLQTPKASVEKKNKNADMSPNTGGSQENNGQKDMWDILYSWNTAGTSEAGVETNGINIFSASWNSSSFYRYSMTGVFLDSFTIAGVTDVRDLAYNPATGYFYGGSNSSNIYEMNFSTHTKISTISCPAGTTVRSIAWDSDAGGFWVGGWDTDVICVSPSGSVLKTITAANLGLKGMYGSAYDPYSPGGPYLWIFDQGAAGTGAYFVQVNIATLKPTGIVHNCNDISPTALAGGAFCYNNAGTLTLGGIAQGEKIFAYDLSAPSTDAGIIKILAPSNSGSCLLTAYESVKVTIKNYGFNSISNFDVVYKINSTLFADTQTVTATILPGGTLDYTFTGTVNLATPGTYNITAYTILAGDATPANDTLKSTAYYADANVTVKIQTDLYGSETTWKLADAATGTVIASGGPYADTDSLYTINVCVPSNSCFKFTIYDAYGDGSCCSYGYGSYEILWNGFSFGVIPGQFTDSAVFYKICKPFAVDVGTFSIDVSNGVPASFKPSATFRNYGTLAQNYINVYMSISGTGTTYNSTSQITTLLSGAYQSVLFPNVWDATVPGTYTVTVWTNLFGDMNTTNDTLKKTINIISVGKKAYGYALFDSTRAIPKGPVILDLENPSTIISLADQSTQNDVYGGTWGNKHWYCSAYNENNLVEIDTLTGKRTVIGPMGVSLNGLAFDHNTNTLYGTNGSSLYTINTTTGAATLTGGMGIPGSVFIGLACNGLTGLLYSVNLADDYFYLINKTTGKATAIGPVGYNANYAQGMAFHPDGTCYLAAYKETANSSSGDLRIVNTLTGATTVVGTFKNGAEIDDLAIPGRAIQLANNVGIIGILSPSNDTSCTLTANEKVKIAIKNYGSSAVSNIPVGYRLNNLNPTPQVAPDIIQPGDTSVYTFPGSVFMASVGTYRISAYTDLPADTFHADDTLKTIVATADNQITIKIKTDDYPLEINWQLINKTTNQIVVSGNSFPLVANSLNTYNICAVSTECYKFIIYDNWGDGISAPGGFEILWNGYSLYSNYAFNSGKDSVDNLCAQKDIGVIQIINPVSECTSSSSETVKVTVKNFSTDPIPSYKISYIINSDTVNATISQPLLINQVYTHSFTGANAANLSIAGTYKIRAYTTLSGDVKNNNDTTTKYIITGPASPPPAYIFGAEWSTADSIEKSLWTILNLNSDATSWNFGSGTNSHAGNGFLYYKGGAAAANDWLFSRCFKFTAGKTYKLTFWFKNSTAGGKTNKLKVFYGNDTTVIGMTNTILNTITINDALASTYTDTFKVFTVPATGIYYLGLYACSAANNGDFYIDDITVTDITGISESPDNFSVNVYPNPANDVINITSSEKIIRINLLNTFGQLVISKEVNSQVSVFNTDNFAEGMYYLQIETEKGVITKNISVRK